MMGPRDPQPPAEATEAQAGPAPPASDANAPKAKVVHTPASVLVVVRALAAPAAAFVLMTYAFIAEHARRQWPAQPVIVFAAPALAVSLVSLLVLAAATRGGNEPENMKTGTGFTALNLALLPVCAIVLHAVGDGSSLSRAAFWMAVAASVGNLAIFIQLMVSAKRAVAEEDLSRGPVLPEAGAPRVPRPDEPAPTWREADAGGA